MCSAISARCSEFRKTIRCVRCGHMTNEALQQLQPLFFRSLLRVQSRFVLGICYLLADRDWKSWSCLRGPTSLAPEQDDSGHKSQCL